MEGRNRVLLSPLHPHFLVEEKPRRKEGSFPTRHNFLLIFTNSSSQNPVFLPAHPKNSNEEVAIPPQGAPVSAPCWNCPFPIEPATHPQLQQIHSCSQEAAEVTLGWPSCLGRQEELIPTCCVWHIRGLLGIFSWLQIFAVAFLFGWGFFKNVNIGRFLLKIEKA